MFPEEAQYTTFWEEIVKKIFSSPSSSFLKKASKLLSPKKSQVESKANLILFLEACVKGLETPAGGYLMYVLNDPQARYSTKMEGDQDFTQSMYGKKRHDIFQRYKAFVESPNLKDVGVDLRLRSQGASASGAWGDPALPASLKTIDPSGWERHHRAQTETPVERRSHGEEQSGPSTAL
jgi:hypothetical protein